MESAIVTDPSSLPANSRPTGARSTSSGEPGAWVTSSEPESPAAMNPACELTMICPVKRAVRLSQTTWTATSIPLT